VTTPVRQQDLNILERRASVLKRTTSSRSSGFDPLRAVLILIIVSSLLRLILAWVLGLGVDESYVASVSRAFSLSYFDHPPIHFWLVRTAALLTGSEQPVILRLPFILLFAGTTWLMYSLTSRLFGERAGFYAALVLNLSAVFSLSTGGWVLPDGPLMFFMLAAVFVLVRIFSLNPARLPLTLWLAFGVLTGLGMLSKYHAVFLLAGLFLYLITSSGRRPLLFTPGPYIAVISALLVFSPVLIWNAQHEWVSFLFHGSRAVSKGFSPGGTLANIAGQAVWLLPWIWLPLVWTLARNICAGPERYQPNTLRDTSWLFCCLASGPIVLFTVATLWGAQGLFHWQAPGYLLALPLLGRAIADKAAVSRRLVSGWLKASAVTFLLLITILASHTATGWLCDSMPEAFTQGDPTLESLDWRDLAPALQEQGYLSPAVNDSLFIVARNWIEAGKIDYALGGALPVVVLSDDPHHYPFIHSLSDLKGKNALIIGRASGMTDAETVLRPYFDSLVRMESITIQRQQRPEFMLTVYQAKNFHGDYPLPFGRR
jgi:hypothetical protein